MLVNFVFIATFVIKIKKEREKSGKHLKLSSRSSGVGFFCFVSPSPQSVKTKETNPTRPGSPTPCKQALSSLGGRSDDPVLPQCWPNQTAEISVLIDRKITVDKPKHTTKCCITIHDSSAYYKLRQQRVFTIHDSLVITVLDNCYYNFRQVLQFTTELLGGFI